MLFVFIFQLRKAFEKVTLCTTTQNGQLASKKKVFFWAYFIRFGKRNNCVEEIFSVETFLVEKTQFENSIFLEHTTRSF
jgi:hypothetical protein